LNQSCPNLKLAASHGQMGQLQSDAIRDLARRLERPLSILEAGCGQAWPIDLTGVDFAITGIDLDPDALALRLNKACDLNAAICADMCAAELPEASFDVVFSGFVLEHVPRADLALENLVKWLKPGGLLILRLPERMTVKGFYTRVLPHWAHVWYYRYVCGSPFAGRPGYAPYPTYYHPVIGCKRLLGFLARHGVKCLSCYADPFRPGFSGLRNMIVSGIVRLTEILSLGYLSAEYSDIHYIAVKNDPALAQN